jgi:ABC-2 type transport system ATP-binding protein
MGPRTTTLIGALVALLALPAAAQGRDAVVESFDGTPRVTHFFPGDGASASKPAPTILVGPGWSQNGETQSQGASGVGGAFGVTSIGTFIKAGYNVLTWDPRGFGGSGGTVQVDDPDYEGRDVSALIDYVARQSESLMDDDSAKDPRLGMAGASYGGGIQLVAAGLDPRIDAIAPTIAWNSLTTALFQDDALKLGWGSLLISLGIEGATAPGLGSPAGPQTGNLDPLFYGTVTDGLATGHATDAEKDYFADNGPDFLLPQVKVPTLLIQGTVDTLFPLDEAVRNFRAIDRNTQSPRHGKGVPVKMIFFCGGHGVCFTGNGPDGYVDSRTLAWFDRYLWDDRKADTGPKFAWIADDGRLRSSRRFPGKRVGVLTGSGSGTLPLVPGASGGGGLIFATPSPIAVNVDIPGPAKAANALGAPKLRLTYEGTASPPSTFTYAQIVNPRKNQVLGNVTTPIPLQLDGSEHSIFRKLVWVAGRAPAGGGYQLQLTPTSTVYDIQRSAGSVDFSSIGVKIPLRKPIRRAQVHR